MQDFPITDTPQFSGSLRKLETTDLAHADTFNPLLQTLLDNDNYLKMESDKLKDIRFVTLLAANWLDESPYIQTVQVEGITREDNPILVKYVDRVGQAEIEVYNDAFWAINQGGAETGDGIVTFWTYERPESDITIGLKGV